MKKLFLLALVAMFALNCFADDAYVVTGSHRSRFVPSIVKNAYKNTLNITVNTLTPTTITVKRTNGAKETSTVATVKVTAAGVCTFTYYNQESDNRYDNETVPKSVTIDEGGTLAVVDYFNFTTKADPAKKENGGDKYGPYVYSVTTSDGTEIGTYTVKTYLGNLKATLTHPYTAAQILADTKHTLDAQGAHVVCSLPDGATQTVKSWKIYREGVEWANTTSKDDDAVESTKQKYQGEMTIEEDGVENTYGTNQDGVYPGYMDVLAYKRAMSTNYTFAVGDKTNCHYFDERLEVDFTYMERETDIALLGYPKIETGGYRVWRTCASSAEEIESLKDRSNDYLIFDNVGASDVTSYVAGIGSTSITYADPKTGTGTCTAGTFGSSEQYPTVNYLVRVYYWMYYETYNPFGAPKRVSVKDDTTEKEYYIAEYTLTDTFTSDITTGVDGVTTNKEISSIKFCNLAGQQSIVPFDGMNIVVTTFTDGTTSTSKMMK